MTPIKDDWETFSYTSLVGSGLIDRIGKDVVDYIRVVFYSGAALSYKRSFNKFMESEENREDFIKEVGKELSNYYEEIKGK